jgi:hypothetical protein
MVENIEEITEFIIMINIGRNQLNLFFCIYFLKRLLFETYLLFNIGSVFILLQMTSLFQICSMFLLSDYYK